MYQSPDLIKVNVSVKDNFAAYKSGCPGDYSGQYIYVGVGCKDFQDPSSLVAGIADYHCYSSYNK